MVIDTSALVAILHEETEAGSFLELITENAPLLLSSVSLVEASIVLQSRKGSSAIRLLSDFIEQSGMLVVPFDIRHAHAAQHAWQKYGKGRHVAALNFGDCCSYALAIVSGQSLLYKGNDFRETDIESAARD